MLIVPYKLLERVDICSIATRTFIYDRYKKAPFKGLL